MYSPIMQFDFEDVTINLEHVINIEWKGEDVAVLYFATAVMHSTRGPLFQLEVTGNLVDKLRNALGRPSRSKK